MAKWTHIHTNSVISNIPISYWMNSRVRGCLFIAMGLFFTNFGNFLAKQLLKAGYQHKLKSVLDSTWQIGRPPINPSGFQICIFRDICSISWLLIHCRLSPPGNQHPWHRIDASVTRTIPFTSVLLVLRNYSKCKYMYIYIYIYIYTCASQNLFNITELRNGYSKHC